MRRPGRRLRAMASRCFSPQTMERLIDPVISDLQTEYEAAVREKRQWQSRWIWLVGHVAFVRVVACHGGQRVMDRMRLDRQIDNRTSQPLHDSRTAALAAAALFVVMSLSFIVPDGLPPGPRQAFHMMTRSWMALVVLALPLAGVTIGWIRHFPRWSFPYVGFALIDSLFLMTVATPHMNLFGIPIFGRESWGWRAFVPLLTVAATCVLGTRSIRPLRRARQRIAQDWTLLTFAMFGFVPLIVGFALDDRDVPVLRLATTLIMVITAVAYIRAGYERTRAMVVIAGTIATLAITTPEVPVFGLIVVTFIASPAVASLLRNAKRLPPELAR